MNYTPFNDAFVTYHIRNDTYGGTIYYNPTCIFCKHNTSTSLMNDGGSFRRCDRCKKNFRAATINKPINNFSYSTHHLKGTN